MIQELQTNEAWFNIYKADWSNKKYIGKKQNENRDKAKHKLHFWSPWNVSIDLCNPVLGKKPAKILYLDFLEALRKYFY